MGTSVLTRPSRVTGKEGSLSSSDDIMSHSAGETDEGGCEHGAANRSHEIMFFHVRQDAVPPTKLGKNYIAKQVIATVNSSTVIPASRGEGG
jgi:hypothetical protein